jgi:hypothetical protein
MRKVVRLLSGEQGPDETHEEYCQRIHDECPPLNVETGEVMEQPECGKPFGFDLKKWWSEYLTPLIGGEIVEVGTKTERGPHTGHWPYLKVQTKDGQEVRLEVSRDEEGNGPGFLFGLPKPT